jgi:hypothetical protein
MPIRHNEALRAPQPGVIYRCHICRLELVLDERTKKLVLVPLPEQT